ncbi:MAG: hypothetical protein AAGJ18_12080, partial [Bacteroidota bacterium]
VMVRANEQLREKYERQNLAIDKLYTQISSNRDRHNGVVSQADYLPTKLLNREFAALKERRAETNDLLLRLELAELQAGPIFELVDTPNPFPEPSF